MRGLFDQGLLGPQEIASYFTVWELLVSLGLSFFLCSIVAYIYRATHKGVSYSQSFVSTTVIVGVVVSVIMLIIGSNIARAFTLVGALSIIRFRNAVKETRDVGFIFLTMTIGMACGTRFYGVAVIFTLVVSAIIYTQHAMNMFQYTQGQLILRLHIPESVDYESAFDDVFYKFFQSSSLLSVESKRQGIFLELVYNVVLRKGVLARELIKQLREINGNAKVILTESESVNV